MVLFKKLKTRLRSFLEKHEDNLFILIPTYLVVGLANILLVMLGIFIISAPMALVAIGNCLGWTPGIIIALVILMVLLFVGFGVCTSIQTNSDYEENKTLFD